MTGVFPLVGSLWVVFLLALAVTLTAWRVSVLYDRTHASALTFDLARAAVLAGGLSAAIAAFTLTDPAFGAQPLLTVGRYSIAHVQASFVSAQLAGALSFFVHRWLAHHERHRWGPRGLG